MYGARSPELTKSPPHRSSSVPSEFDSSIDKLAEYFKWLIKVNPTKAEPLAKYLETFRKEDIVFGTIEDISDTLFDTWGVSQGLKLMLKSHLKKWKRSKAKGH